MRIYAVSCKSLEQQTLLQLKEFPGLESEQWDEQFGHTRQGWGAGEWFVNSHNH